MMTKIKKLLGYGKRKNRSLTGDLSLFTILAIFGIFSGFPLVYAFFNAFKPFDELFVFPPRIIPNRITLDNFYDLQALIGNSWVPFTRYLFNTIFITGVGTAGHVIFASMAAYPLAKHKVLGQGILFALVVYSLMFANEVTAIPNYITMNLLGLIDSQWAIVIPAFSFPLGLYLMKQFMGQIPQELIDSAKVDGASEFMIYRKIVMPLVKPAWLTLIILLFKRLWTTDGGRFIYSEELKPVSYALRQVVNAGVARAGTSAAVTLIMMIVPITVFIVTQSKIIETFTHSGMK